jgi:hypothetical protein
MHWCAGTCDEVVRCLVQHYCMYLRMYVESVNAGRIVSVNVAGAYKRWSHL